MVVAQRLLRCERTAELRPIFLQVAWNRVAATIRWNQAMAVRPTIGIHPLRPAFDGGGYIKPALEAIKIPQCLGDEQETKYDGQQTSEAR